MAPPRATLPPMRRLFVGGNWKMHTDRRGAAELAAAVARAAASLGPPPSLDIALFPPFPYLLEVGRVLRDAGSTVQLGAQDVWHRPDGPFTGEVSVAMLRDCGVQVVLCGHSERRHTIGEPDALVAAKLRAVLDAGLVGLLCIGETLDQRRAGQIDAVNRRQLQAAIADCPPEQLHRLVIAYEPVWAIGTGQTATPDDAQRAHVAVRAVLESMHGPALARSTRILYGGSVSPQTAPELIAQPDVDGFLVGGASLSADTFEPILAACQARATSRS